MTPFFYAQVGLVGLKDRHVAGAFKALATRAAGEHRLSSSRNPRTAAVVIVEAVAVPLAHRHPPVGIVVLKMSPFLDHYGVRRMLGRHHGRRSAKASRLRSRARLRQIVFLILPPACRHESVCLPYSLYLFVSQLLDRPPLHNLAFSLFAFHKCYRSTSAGGPFHGLIAICSRQTSHRLLTGFLARFAERGQWSNTARPQLATHIVSVRPRSRRPPPSIPQHPEPSIRTSRPALLRRLASCPHQRPGGGAVPLT